MQILILGMHRSGTSAAARLINMMGCYFAPENMALGAKPENPKGFWERRDALYLNDELLTLQHCKWNQLSNWHFKQASQAPQHLLGAMHHLITSLNGSRPWFLKDPRMCLTLPAWLPLLETPIALIVHRTPLEIAISLQHRNAMPIEYSLALWEYHAVGILNTTLHLPRLFLQHEHIINQPVACCEYLMREMQQLHIPHISMPDEQDILSFIDPTLHHAKAAEHDNHPALTEHQKQLIEYLCGRVEQTDKVNISPDSLQIIRAGLNI